MPIAVLVSLAVRQSKVGKELKCVHFDIKDFHVIFLCAVLAAALVVVNVDGFAVVAHRSAADAGTSETDATVQVQLHLTLLSEQAPLLEQSSQAGVDGPSLRDGDVALDGDEDFTGRGNLGTATCASTFLTKCVGRMRERSDTLLQGR
jgi:hypothetical protein